MRFRTAAILSVVLIGGFFGLPDVIKAVFLPSLEQSIPAPTPIPVYEGVLLQVAFFCFRFRLLLALPIAVVVVTLFIVAGFTSVLRLRNQVPHP